VTDTKTLPQQLQRLARAAQVLATEATALECTLAAEAADTSDDEGATVQDAEPAERIGWCLEHGEVEIDDEGDCLASEDTARCFRSATGLGAYEALRLKGEVAHLKQRLRIGNDTLGQIIRERDEARADSDRLRAEVGRLEARRDEALLGVKAERAAWVKAAGLAREARGLLLCRASVIGFPYGAPRYGCGCYVCALARRIDALPAVEASDG
jgi:hypothetical protein